MNRHVSEKWRRPSSRVFRLKEHGAVINRYGFNSEGHNPAKGRLEVGLYRLRLHL
jgi:dihydroorotate dehydrogenase